MVGKSTDHFLERLLLYEYATPGTPTCFNEFTSRDTLTEQLSRARKL